MTRFFNSLGKHMSSTGRRPLFYLVYLVFYFVPWFEKAPNTNEIFLTVLVIGLFIPVHFMTFAKSGHKRIGLIAVTEFFAALTAPINAMNGVFHIYATSQAGYQRSTTISAILFFVLTFIYMAVSYAFDRHIYEILFVIFMSAITWITCLQDANQLAEAEERERVRELEKQQASITERERIARDLHDLLGHTLTMVSLKSDLVLKLMDKDPDAARAEIDDIRTSSRKALTDIRAVLSGMNQTSIESELANAKLALETANISLTIQGERPALNSVQEQVAALAIREAATNIIRHSDASEVTLAFLKDETDHFIQIEDNGSGSTQDLGAGLRGLKDRVAQIGGSTVIDLTGGARIAVILPMQALLK